MASKYERLQNYLEKLAPSNHEVTLRFEEIERIINARLPKSARTYRQWWANQAESPSRPQSYAWQRAGFIVDSVHFSAQPFKVTFKRK